MQVVATAGTADLQPHCCRLPRLRGAGRGHLLVGGRQQLVDMPGSQEGVTVVESVRRLARFHVAYRVQNLDPLAVEQTRLLTSGCGREGESTAGRLDAMGGDVRVSVPRASGVTEGVDQHSEQSFILMWCRSMTACHQQHSRTRPTHSPPNLFKSPGEPAELPRYRAGSEFPNLPHHHRPPAGVMPYSFHQATVKSSERTMQGG